MCWMVFLASGDRGQSQLAVLVLLKTTAGTDHSKNLHGNNWSHLLDWLDYSKPQDVEEQYSNNALEKLQDWWISIEQKKNTNQPHRILDILLLHIFSFFIFL